MNHIVPHRTSCPDRVLWFWVCLLLYLQPSPILAKPVVKIMGEEFSKEKAILYKTLQRRGFSVRPQKSNAAETLRVYLLSNKQVRMLYGSERHTFHLPASAGNPTSRCRAIVALVGVFLERAEQKLIQQQSMEREEREKEQQVLRLRRQRKRRQQRKVKHKRWLERRRRPSRIRKRRALRQDRIRRRGWAKRQERVRQHVTKNRREARATLRRQTKDRTLRSSPARQTRRPKQRRELQSRNATATKVRNDERSEAPNTRKAPAPRKESLAVIATTAREASPRKTVRTVNRVAAQKKPLKKSLLPAAKDKKRRRAKAIKRRRRQRLAFVKIRRRKALRKSPRQRKQRVFLDLGVDAGLAVGQLSILTGGVGVSVALRLWDASIVLEAGVHRFSRSESQEPRGLATYRFGISGGWRTPLWRKLKQTDLHILAGVHILPMVVEQQQGARQVPQVGLSLSSQFEWHFFNQPTWRFFRRWSWYVRTGFAGLLLRYEADPNGLDRRAYPSPWQYFLLSGIQVRL